MNLIIFLAISAVPGWLAENTMKEGDFGLPDKENLTGQHLTRGD